MGPINRKDAAAAGRQWDAFVLGWPRLDAEPDADFADTIAQFQAEDDTPHVDRAFADRLGAKLAVSGLTQSVDVVEGAMMNPSATLPTGSIGSTNGHKQGHENELRKRIPSRYRKMPTWLGSTAFLLALLVVVASLIPGRPSLFNNGNKPAHNLAGSPTTAPEAQASKTGGMYRGDAARTGAMPGPGPEGEPNLIWKNQEGNYSSQAPVVVGSRLFTTRYTPEDTNELVAIEVKTGADIWTASMDEVGGLMIPAAANGLVFMPTTDGLKAYDQKTGEVQWTYTADGTVTDTSPVVSHGLVFFTVSDYTLRAVNTKTGEEKWQVRIPGVPVSTRAEGWWESTLAVSDEIVYGVSLDFVNPDGFVYAVDATDGHELWIKKVEGGFAEQSLMVADGVVLAPSTVWRPGWTGAPGRLNAFDAKSGDRVWDTLTFGSGITLAAGDGQFYVEGDLETGPFVEARDTQTGKLRWTFDGGSYLSDPVVVDDTVYVSNTLDGTIHRIAADTGKSDWSVYLNAGDPVVVDGLVIAAGYRGMFAVGGGGTANGQPMASGAIDLSGLPPCEPPRTNPTEELTGVTKASLLDGTAQIVPVGSQGMRSDGRMREMYVQPQILSTYLPTGPAAGAEANAGIQDAFQEMSDCAQRAEGYRQLQGFYSDDFFRRNVASFGPNGYDWMWRNVDEKDLASLSVFELDDGRIAATSGDNVRGPQELYIFVEEDGYWLIDEYYSVVSEFFYGPLG